MGVQLSIGDILYGVTKRFRLILALTIAGLVIGIILSGMTYLQGSMTRNYEITSSVVLVAKGKSGSFSTTFEEPQRTDFQFSQDMVDTIRYILRSDGTLNEVIDELGLIGITSKNLGNNLKISQYNETPIIEFSLTWRSAEEGTKILEKLLGIADEVMQKTVNTGALETITEPVAKYIVGGSLNVPLWGIMAILGFLAGIALSSMDILLRPTLINLRDVQTEFKLETVGVIPKDDDYFKEDKAVTTESSVVDQDYSAAAYIVRNRMGTNKKNQKIYITSSIRGEGRTSVAINLAKHLSEMEKKVLLVDFDTANPEIGMKMLGGVDFDRSLNALYRGDITENEAVTSINGYLDVLPAVLEHNPVPIDGMILNLVDKLSERYDYVIMDAPPVGQVSGALSINQIADAALLVIGFDMSQKAQITESIDRLEKSGIKILGSIVNQEKSLETFSLFEKNENKKQKKNKGKKENHYHKKQEDVVAEMTKKNEDKDIEESEQKEQPTRKEKQAKKRDKRKKNTKENTETKDQKEEEIKPQETAVPVQRDLMGEMFKTEKELSDEEMFEQLISLGSQNNDKK